MYFIEHNELFAQSRGWILLIDSFPPIEKMFSIVHKKEKQREVDTNSQNSNNQFAYAVWSSTSKSKNSNKNRPLRANCSQAIERQMLKVDQMVNMIEKVYYLTKDSTSCYLS